MAGAPQEAAADVPHSQAGTDNWWEDMSEMQRPQTLPVYVPITRVTGNVMYNSLPVVALKFAARNSCSVSDILWYSTLPVVLLNM